MIKKMERLNFIQAVSALKVLTKPNPYVVDIDERPFISRLGMNQWRIALSGGRLYDVHITDYDGHHNVWCDYYAPRVEDIFANDWEVWTC